MGNCQIDSPRYQRKIDGDYMKLLLRNLSRSTSQEDLSALLTNNNITSCKLVLDTKTGKSKGFAFAVIPDEKDALAAIKRLNGKIVDGKKIRVKETEERQRDSFSQIR